MKFFKTTILLLIGCLSFQNCKKNDGNLWEIEIKKSVPKVDIIDISKEFYDLNIPLTDFEKKYPWFKGNMSDDIFVKRRNSKDEAQIYKMAISKLDESQLKKNLEKLFLHIQYYFPEFQVPKVYLYSSAFQGVIDPVFYRSKENLLFIDITGFLGEKDKNYQGLEDYYLKTMNQKNLIPKISMVISENIVNRRFDNPNFLEQMIYQGKLQILQDAFLPTETDDLKIGFTKKEYDWCIANEPNIWNYFVEKDLLFSDDSQLVERFIALGPFSKFYTEIDQESSAQVGVFIGKRICEKYFKNNKEEKLVDFIQLSSKEIFNKSKYNPKFK